MALPTESVYCLTKVAISYLTKCLALEWAPHHIYVNAVAPTFIKTPDTRKWLDEKRFAPRWSSAFRSAELAIRWI